MTANAYDYALSTAKAAAMSVGWNSDDFRRWERTATAVLQWCGFRSAEHARDVALKYGRIVR